MRDFPMVTVTLESMRMSMRHALNAQVDEINRMADAAIAQALNAEHIAGLVQHHLYTELNDIVRKAVESVVREEVSKVAYDLAAETIQAYRAKR